ncbi:SDR family NAD(P)-dependent oxidoreductase [Nosocomiicoccus sp. HMSC09A07]|uniref:SDR family NAD(P)-dependent oxidoreductase n=1 Tax=Nosocomiicoccus sp. HMSC09A07 TaxID=1581145 RepID=UPI0008A38779|nr:SDR family oxidoreductase [Nosocomiicoccus sp. HMSC09A07]OFS63093.1 3-oxoacyl-[acyl-carrier-protein] reductase [Nosocomiicoccus sp. HMSC09A07]
MFDLTKKIALVTGGANGIGKGISTMLQKAGAFVIIADLDKENGEKVAKELNGEFYELDVTNLDGIEKTVDSIVESHGKIDILASNTGIFPQKFIEDMSEADYDKVLDVNLKSSVFVSKAVLKHMKKANYGRVIFTSSVTGPITGYPGWAHYGASKAAQLGFMRSAALEYAKYGITVNSVQPGNVLTEGLKAQGEEYLEGTKSIIPMHELGKPEDIGAAVAFFASDEAGYITGQSIVVDGGQILPEEPDGIL